MRKILLTLIICTHVSANCLFTLNVDIDQNIDPLFNERIELKSSELLNRKNYLSSSSTDIIRLKLKLDKEMDHYKMTTMTLVRVNGTLKHYAYGESKRYRSYESALRMKPILSSISQSIKQLPRCSHD